MPPPADSPGAAAGGRASAGDVEPSRRRRSPAARGARGLAWFLIGLLGLIAAAGVLGTFAARTDWLRERARVFALERLRSAVEGEVRVGRLEGDLLRGVRMEDVSITGPGGEPFLSARRIEVTYRVGGFLRREILLGTARLVEPRVTLVQDPAGEWNLFRILPFLRGGEGPREPGGWGSVVRVGALRIADAEVRVVSRRGPRPFGPLGDAFTLAGLSGTFEVDVSSREGGGTRLAAQGVEFVLRERDLPVDELEGEFAITPEGLAFEGVRLRTPRTELAARGRVRRGEAVGDEPVLDLTLRVDPLSLEEAAGFVPRLPYRQGTLRGTVGVTGPADDLRLTLRDFALRTPRSLVTAEGAVSTEPGPRADARLTLAPLAAEDVRALWGGWFLEEPVRGELALEGWRDSLSVAGDLAFGTTESTVSGTLRLAGREPAYDVRLAARGLDLEDVLHAPAWSSVVNGEFRIAGVGLGTGARAAFGGTLRDSRVLFYEIRAGSFEGRFRPGSPGAFHVDAFQLSLPSSTIQGSGVMPYDYTLDLELAAVSRNVRDFYPGIGPMPAAPFEATGRLAGPYAGLDLTLSATADSLAWNGLVADDFAGSGTFTDLGRPGFRMALEGVGSGVDYLGPIRFETARFQAGFEGDTMGVTVDARMDSARTAEGHLDIDFSGDAPRVVLDRGTMSVGAETYVVEEPSGFLYRSGAFAFDDFALVNGEERLAIDGTLRVDGPQDFGFELRGVSLDDLQALAGVDPRATGTLDGSGRVTGTDAAPVIDGAFELSEGRVGELRVHRMGGSVDYAERSLALDVEIAPETLGADSLEDPGIVTLRGELPVDLAFGAADRRILDGPMDLTVESSGLSLALVQSFAPRQVRASGPLELGLRLTGRPSDPRVEGRLAVREGRLGNLSIHALSGSLEYEDRRLGFELTLAPETEGADRREDPGELTARGTFPIDLSLGAVARRVPEAPIDVAVESRGLTLGLLRSFSPRLSSASGPVEVDVRLTGTPSQPRYEGQLAVRDGALRLGGGARYTGIAGAVLFDNDRVEIRDLRVSSASGDARVEGRIALRELALGDIEARLLARRFTLIDEGDRELLVDADIALAGTTRQPSISGTVNVEQMSWPMPERSDRDVIDLDEAILYVRAEGDTAQRSPPPDVWRQTLVDLDVNVEDDAILRSDQALIVLQGDLSIQKPRGRDVPSMAGTLDVVRGFYAEFGNQFEVVEGEVFFYGTPDLNPGLHIIATTEVDNAAQNQRVEVTLTLGGTLNRPTLEVSSNPAYEKSEVFSLLLFGSPTPGQGEQQQFESTIARVASRQAALPLQRALAAELGLDLLEVSPGVGFDGGRFRAGKYLGSDVFVTYTQTTGVREESTFGIQYRLSRSWTLETQAGSRSGRAQLGADIFYEFQY